MSGSTASTTTVPFVPSDTTPFAFQATFNGAPYVCTTVWNLYRQDFYLNVVDQYNNQVGLYPLIGSPADYTIDIMVGALAPASLSFLTSGMAFVINPGTAS